jgi:hypothetical protein
VRAMLRPGEVECQDAYLHLPTISLPA